LDGGGFVTLATVPLLLSGESEENREICQDIRQPDEYSKPVTAELYIG
jgi:hypothetical protein